MSKKRIMKFVLVNLLLFFSCNALADPATTIPSNLSSTPSTKIARIVSFSQLGNGDFTLHVENNAVGCEGGFWIGGSDLGKDEILSTALSAFYTNSQVILEGDKDRRWGPSNDPFCHLFKLIIDK